jgi:hypothetical protein
MVTLRAERGAAFGVEFRVSALPSEKRRGRFGCEIRCRDRPAAQRRSENILRKHSIFSAQVAHVWRDGEPNVAAKIYFGSTVYFRRK